MSKRRSASLFNPSNLSSDLLKQAQQNAFRAGLKQGLSPLPGIAAWGMVVGVAMIKTDFHALASLRDVAVGVCRLGTASCLTINCRRCPALDYFFDSSDGQSTICHFFGHLSSSLSSFILAPAYFLELFNT